MKKLKLYKIKKTKVKVLWSKKKAHKNTWKLMSLYIRLRDCHEDVRRLGITTCICGAMGTISSMDCGHYIHGGNNQYSLTDFNEFNLHTQCKRCNHFDKETGHRLFERYMQMNHKDKISMLELLKKQKNTYGIAEYAAIQQELKQKIERLKWTY